MVQWLLEWLRYLPRDVMSDLGRPLVVTRCESPMSGKHCYHDRGPVGLGGCSGTISCTVAWYRCKCPVWASQMWVGYPVDQQSPEQLWRSWMVHEIMKSSSTSKFIGRNETGALMDRLNMFGGFDILMWDSSAALTRRVATFWPPVQLTQAHVRNDKNLFCPVGAYNWTSTSH